MNRRVAFARARSFSPPSLSLSLFLFHHTYLFKKRLYPRKNACPLSGKRIARLRRWKSTATGCAPPRLRGSPFISFDRPLSSLAFSSRGRCSDARDPETKKRRRLGNSVLLPPRTLPIPLKGLELNPARVFTLHRHSFIDLQIISQTKRTASPSLSLLPRV